MALRVYVGYSKIHGRGMFARSALKIGESFSVPSWEIPHNEHQAVEDPGGNYHMLYNPYCFLNHSDDPNSVLYYGDGVFTLEIIKNIPKNIEVTFDYEG